MADTRKWTLTWIMYQVCASCCSHWTGSCLWQADGMCIALSGSSASGNIRFLFQLSTISYYSGLPFLNNIGTYEADSAQRSCERRQRYAVLDTTCQSLVTKSCQIRVWISNGSCSNGLLEGLIPEWFTQLVQAVLILKQFKPWSKYYLDPCTSLSFIKTTINTYSNMITLYFLVSESCILVTEFTSFISWN